MVESPEQFQLFKEDVRYKPNLELLGRLRDESEKCAQCELRLTCNRVVFGSGLSVRPDIALVGEAPGETEDKLGQPFVGKAGKLLDKMLEAMGYSRDTVYLLNTVNCRPPGNRTPSKIEIAACSRWLVGQIQAIRPKTLVALGGCAGNALLRNRKDEPVGALRGKWWSLFDVPLRVSYHPAALLRNPELKLEAWADLQEVIKLVKSIA